MNTNALHKRIKQQNAKLREHRREIRVLEKALYVVGKDLDTLASVLCEASNGVIPLTDLVKFLRKHYPNEAVKILPEPLRKVGQASMDLRMRMLKPMAVGRKK